MLKTTNEELHDLQLAQAYQHDTTSKSGNNADVMQMDKPSHYKSQIHFESDTFIYNNILLDLAKYIHGILLLSFLSTTPLRLWGSVGYKPLLWYIYYIT